VLAFLAVLFFALALSPFGLFELALPASIQTKLMGVGRPDSKLGIYLMGLFAGIVISPCVGPIVAGILAFVFESSNAFLGMTYFFSFSLGLGMLFLVLGGFSTLLSELPKSGSWMTRINKILGTLLLAASLYYGHLWAKQVGFVERELPASSENGITWMTDENQALEKAKKDKLPIILDLTAEWCVVCHEIEVAVFHKPRVIKAMQTTIIPLRIDVTEENEVNLKILSKYAVIGLPTILFLYPDGRIMDEPRINGLIDADTFLQMHSLAIQKAQSK